MRIFEHIRNALFLVGGILIIIFYKSLLPYVEYLVGGIMIVYGVENIIEEILKKEIFLEHTRFFDDVILMVLGTVMMIVFNQEKYFTEVYVVWAVWSILREGREFNAAVQRIKNKRPGITNAIESIIVIILSLMLMLNPHEEHALVHIILLGVELLLEVVFPTLDNLYVKYVLANKRQE